MRKVLTSIYHSGIAPPLDLYDEYQKQFMSPAAKSALAPTTIPYYKKATDLYYYVTYYDKDVMDISHVSDDGKMSYTILKKADYDTYMNVVFVIK